MIGVLWILAVHRRQHSNRWRRWRTWLAHAVCSCHVPQLQNAPPPPPQHPTSDEGHSWRRRASSQHHGTGIVDGILCILCRCRCVQRRRTPSILRPHARAERALPERLLALTVSSHLLFTQKYAGRFTDIADSRHVKLAGFQFSRLAGFKFFTTSVGKSRKNMLAVSRALGLSMASSRALVERQSAAAAPELAAPTDARRSSRREAHCGNVAARWFSIVFTTSDGRDRRSAAVLWFERLLLLCGV